LCRRTCRITRNRPLSDSSNRGFCLLRCPSEGPRYAKKTTRTCFVNWLYFCALRKPLKTPKKVGKRVRLPHEEVCRTTQAGSHRASEPPAYYWGKPGSVHLKTMKTSKITVKFKTKTQVELNIGNRTAVVETPNHANARQLAALAEAGLLEVNDDNITVRVNANQLTIGARIVTEIRHGNRLFISEYRRGQRRLIRIYEVQNGVNN